MESQLRMETRGKKIGNMQEEVVGQIKRRRASLKIWMSLVCFNHYFIHSAGFAIHFPNAYGSGG